MMQSHPLQMRRHINMLVCCVHTEPGAFPCRREAVDVLRQVPVSDRISVSLHNIADGDDLLALEGFGIFVNLADGAAEDVPDGILDVCRWCGGG